MARYQVLIDRSLCSGYGACAEIAPNLISLDKHGEATLRCGETDDDGILDAAAACPMGAISAYDTTSGKQAA